MMIMMKMIKLHLILINKLAFLIIFKEVNLKMINHKILMPKISNLHNLEIFKHLLIIYLKRD